MAGLFGGGLLASLFQPRGMMTPMGDELRNPASFGRTWDRIQNRPNPGMQGMMGPMGFGGIGGVMGQQQPPQTAGQLPPMQQRQAPPARPIMPVGGVPRSGPLIPGMGRAPWVRPR